jgi:hypothetical protein
VVAAWSAAGLATVAAGVAVWQARAASSQAASAERQAKAAEEQNAIAKLQLAQANHERSTATAAEGRRAALDFLDAVRRWITPASQFWTVSPEATPESLYMAYWNGIATVQTAKLKASELPSDSPLGRSVAMLAKRVDTHNGLVMASRIARGELPEEMRGQLIDAAFEVQLGIEELHGQLDNLADPENLAGLRASDEPSGALPDR